MPEALDTRPFVSVIIPTHRDWARLEGCLHALEQQTYPEDRFEVIVVDNAAESDPPFAPGTSNVTLVSEPRPGSYAARNAGIARSRGEILAFTDSDCVPHPHWIEEAVEQLLASPGIDRLAGRIELFLTGQDTPTSLYERVFAFHQHLHAAKGTSVTANMISRRRVFEEVGLFDATMESGDDTQWGLRANAQGYALAYAPDAVVRHPARSEIAEMASKMRRVTRGRFRIDGWHERPLIVRLAASLLFLRPPVFATWEIVRNRETSPREKLLVLGVLLRLRAHQWSEHVRLSFERPSEPREPSPLPGGEPPARSAPVEP